MSSYARFFRRLGNQHPSLLRYRPEGKRHRSEAVLVPHGEPKHFEKRIINVHGKTSKKLRHDPVTVELASEDRADPDRNKLPADEHHITVYPLKRHSGFLHDAAALYVVFHITRFDAVKLERVESNRITRRAASGAIEYPQYLGLSTNPISAE